MAALNLSTVARPSNGFITRRVALEATAGNARRVQLPAWCRVVTVTFLQSDEETGDTGQVCETGTDGNAIGNDTFHVPSGAAVPIPVAAGGMARNDGGQSIYLAGGTNSGYAYLLLQVGSEL